MINKKKRVLVDLSATIVHHGHVRLIKKAKKFGNVIIALTTDKEIKKHKGYYPELNFSNRKEILESIKYVDKVIKSNLKITNQFLKKNKIDILIRGSDYRNERFEIPVKIFSRTRNISSSKIRKKSAKIII